MYYLKNPIYKLYLSFLRYILDIVNKLNLEFHSEKVKIHTLLDKVSDLYRNILRNFLKAAYIEKNKDNLKTIDTRNPYNFLHLDNFYLGT